MKYGVGIDISKGKSTVAILSVVGEVIEEPFEITHDLSGLKVLEEKIKNIPKEDLKIVMEETGTYHLPVFGYLIDKGYFVVAENALKIKKYLDRGLRKAKTDKKDSYKLAEYACDNWYKLNMAYDNEEIYDNLRFLSRQYITSIEIQVQEKVNFSNLCDLLFPGYYQLLDDNTFILGLDDSFPPMGYRNEENEIVGFDIDVAKFFFATSSNIDPVRIPSLLPTISL